MNCSKDTNNNSSDSPVITSGMTNGAAVIPDSSVRPLNGPNLARVTPASVPRMTAPHAEIAAISIDSPAAPRIWAFENSSPYHLSVGECAASQTVTNLELLNEKTTIDRMGTYRKTSPNTSALRENTPCDFTCASPLRDAPASGTAQWGPPAAAASRSPPRSRPASLDSRRTRPTALARS